MESKDFKVELSRDIPAPVEKLYDAWINPDQLKQWWKPMNNELVEVTNDLKEGGTVRYVFQNNGLVISGEYLEVKEKEKLVYTWNWELPKDAVKDSAFQLTVEFAGKGDQSSIHIVQDNFNNEEGTVVHKEGWEKGLNDLEQFLSGSN